MEDTQDFYPLPSNTVGNEIRGAADNQFSGTMDPARASQTGLGEKKSSSLLKAQTELLSCGRIVLGDIRAYCFEITNRPTRPDQRHRGAFCSRFVPQVWSHACTSW